MVVWWLGSLVVGWLGGWMVKQFGDWVVLRSVILYNFVTNKASGNHLAPRMKRTAPRVFFIIQRSSQGDQFST